MAEETPGLMRRGSRIGDGAFIDTEMSSTASTVKWLRGLYERVILQRIALEITQIKGE